MVSMVEILKCTCMVGNLNLVICLGRMSLLWLFVAGLVVKK